MGGEGGQGRSGMPMVQVLTYAFNGEGREVQEDGCVKKHDVRERMGCMCPPKTLSDR